MNKPTEETMKTILTTILLIAALLTAGSAMGEMDVTLETYDMNNDGVIDADERIALDIDIENARIRISESMFEGGYTTTGSLILNDEFQDFAFAEKQSGYVPIEDPSPSTDPETEIIADVVTVEPDPEPTETATDEGPVMEDVPPAKSSSLPILIGVGIVLLAAAAAYLYYRNKRETDDKDK